MIIKYILLVSSLRRMRLSLLFHAAHNKHFELYTLKIVVIIIIYYVKITKN